MAMVVETVSATATGSSTSTVTITKPTGLSEGDLMVALLSAYSGDGGQSASSYNTKSGWTLGAGVNDDNDIVLSLQWKIADASDVAASNFAFNTNATADNVAGKLLRASGQAYGGYVGTSDTQTNEGALSTTFTGSLTEYTPPVDGSLVCMMVAGVWTSGGSARTVSGYTTSGVSYTEGFDTWGGGSGGSFVASAYGIQASASAISTYSATIDTTTNDLYGILVVFLPPVNVSASNTLFTTDATTFTQTGTCDTIGGTNTLATASAESLTQSGKGTTPMQWTNETKPTTSWTNETL